VLAAVDRAVNFACDLAIRPPPGESRSGGKVTISIPPTKHDLSGEAGDVNSPRVLRTVEGDFISQVKISGNVRHKGNRLSDQYLAYHGGGCSFDPITVELSKGIKLGIGAINTSSESFKAEFSELEVFTKEAS